MSSNEQTLVKISQNPLLKSNNTELYRNNNKKKTHLNVRVILNDTGNPLSDEYVGCGAENATQDSAQMLREQL